MAVKDETREMQNVFDTAGVVRLENKDQATLWYEKAVQYWKSIPATVNGVMGGLGNISSADVAESKKLIADMKTLLGGLQTLYALDCGAGIGRVSKRLLLPLFDKVDLVEQNPLFLEKAKTYIGPAISRVGGFYAVGLQDFVPEKSKYDVIWCQWVLPHLTDKDLTSFFGRCIAGLRPGGVIVVKENIAEGVSVHDVEDSSVSRTRDEFLDIFSACKLEIIMERRQTNFPQELYEVYMFVLKPEDHH